MHATGIQQHSSQCEAQQAQPDGGRGQRERQPYFSLRQGTIHAHIVTEAFIISRRQQSWKSIKPLRSTCLHWTFANAASQVAKYWVPAFMGTPRLALDMDRPEMIKRFRDHMSISYRLSSGKSRAGETLTTAPNLGWASRLRDRLHACSRLTRALQSMV